MANFNFMPIYSRIDFHDTIDLQDRITVEYAGWIDDNIIKAKRDDNKRKAKFCAESVKELRVCPKPWRSPTPERIAIEEMSEE